MTFLFLIINVEFLLLQRISKVHFCKFILSIHTKLKDFSIVSLGLPKVSAHQIFKAVYKIPKGVNIYYIYRWIL